jgi:hypothetical protein
MVDPIRASSCGCQKKQSEKGLFICITVSERGRLGNVLTIPKSPFLPNFFLVQTGVFDRQEIFAHLQS